jgi:hypothetical protein
VYQPRSAAVVMLMQFLTQHIKQLIKKNNPFPDNLEKIKELDLKEIL